MPIMWSYCQVERSLSNMVFGFVIRGDLLDLMLIYQKALNLF